MFYPTAFSMTHLSCGTTNHNSFLRRHPRSVHRNVKRTTTPSSNHHGAQHLSLPPRRKRPSLTLTPAMPPTTVDASRPRHHRPTQSTAKTAVSLCSKSFSVNSKQLSPLRVDKRATAAAVTVVEVMEGMEGTDRQALEGTKAGWRSTAGPCARERT
jgi:hypothetical protein